MEDRGNRYLIVGAGVSGLAAARHFMSRGIPFDVVDRNPGPGGLWDWRVPDNGMYQSAHFISSKNRTAFPGFPMPESYPDFPSNEQVLAYLGDFARRHNLVGSIEFEREVRWMEPAGGPGDGWRVILDRQEERRYRGVVLAIGHFWDPVYPEIPGHFNGPCLHSAHYKTRNLFAGKRVLIVGLGNSACDIACDAVQAGAASVTVSARSGAWIVPKYMMGEPADGAGGKWTGRLPERLRHWLNGLALRLLAPRPERFGLPAPQHAFHERIPVVNTLFLYYIGHGRIDTRPGIAALDGRRICFTDQSEMAADVLVYCTGYRVSFPFLDRAHLNPQGSLPGFHLHVFHPERDDLFLIGIHEQASGGWSMHDAQARMVAHYLALLDRESEAIGRVRAALPKLHRQVRQVSERLFQRGGANFAIQVEEQIYKKALSHLQALLHAAAPRPDSEPLQARLRPAAEPSPNSGIM